MKNEKLIILCDQIQTGKTSAINDTLNYLKPCKGFICPDINGKRVLVNTENMSIHEFQIPKPIFSGDQTIGKFTFLGSTIKLAHRILHDIPNNFDGYVTIDEIGKLELINKGFEPALSAFLNKMGEMKATVILVIRNYLLEEVMDKYQLKNALVLNPEKFKDYFKKLNLNG